MLVHYSDYIVGRHLITVSATDESGASGLQFHDFTVQAGMKWLSYTIITIIIHMCIIMPSKMYYLCVHGECVSALTCITMVV